MRAAEQVTQAVHLVRDAAVRRAFVLALDGHSGVGKSTLASAVADSLDAAVVHVDDFYRDMPDSERLHMTPEQGVDRYFDWERLRSEAIMPLARGARAEFGCFDWVTGHGLTKAISVEPRNVLLVEGVYAARPEFDDLLDLKVLVDLPAPVREERRRQRARTVSRDDPDGWDARWHAAECHYFRSIRPRKMYDLIVPGDG